MSTITNLKLKRVTESSHLLLTKDTIKPLLCSRDGLQDMNGINIGEAAEMQDIVGRRSQ